MNEWERTFIIEHQVARLATADANGQPYVIPIVYAFDGQYLYTPIDAKPKRVGAYQLRRARNIQANPHVAVIIDDYHEDWRRLAWVQVRGTATIKESGPDHARGVTLLHDKYSQYESMPLTERPIIVITPVGIASWQAT